MQLIEIQVLEKKALAVHRPRRLLSRGSPVRGRPRLPMFSIRCERFSATSETRCRRFCSCCFPQSSNGSFSACQTIFRGPPGTSLGFWLRTRTEILPRQQPNSTSEFESAGLKRIDKSEKYAIGGGFVCLIGPGDSTKSTILDAIDFALSSRWKIDFDDSDFFNGDTSQETLITVTVGAGATECRVRLKIRRCSFLGLLQH